MPKTTQTPARLTHAIKHARKLKRQRVKGCSDWGYVYAIRDGEHVKLGVASNVTLRMFSLQTGNPRPLTLVRSWLVQNSQAIEEALHERYAALRLRGEWFAMPASVLNELAQCEDITRLAKP
jgi:hypothetical protein